jgi:RNA-directed DNA polymerase
MSHLQKLRDARTLRDVANILGFKPSGLAYILYKMPDTQKYTSFEIPKRSGGMRQIEAPAPSLRLLQRRLASVLYLCLDEIEKSGRGRRSLAHGFERKRSIVTNASLHKRRRYVLNLDLEDFFPSFNFGRIRGFFVKDKHFALNEKVATLVAQIACHHNQLPQGSPCSPIISNLVGHLLDVRLARMAKTHKCTYSRYADDITFSTNQKEFPSQLAFRVSETSQWQLGAALLAEIENAGFRVNQNKTRMQLRGSRQVTTGLLVNEKVNIRPEYYRAARAMCHALFSTGIYYRLVPASFVGGKPKSDPVKMTLERVAQLEGMLAHIHYVKRAAAHQQHTEKSKTPSAETLYARFLFYKNFVALKAPLIVTEGKTDPIYLRAAIKKLVAYHPGLCKVVEGKFSTSVRFMNFTRTVHGLLHVGNGTGGLKQLILRYMAMLKTFHHTPLAHPVIIVVDNDDGAAQVFKVANQHGALTISYASTEPYYHICANLYLVKTPEIGANLKSNIEALFAPELLETVIDGKTFDPNKEHGEAGKYGKLVFADKVIKPQADTIDFSRFAQLLDRIVAVINDYETPTLKSAIA